MPIVRIMAALAVAAAGGIGDAAEPIVQIVGSASGWTLTRDAAPFVVKGLAGRGNLTVASAIGANSIRTYDTSNLGPLLDEAAANGMMVMVGMWLDQGSAAWSATYQQARRNELATALDTALSSTTRRSALLGWALGNEINGSTADTDANWVFVDQLAQQVADRDTRHPISAVLRYPSTASLARIKTHAPFIAMLGVNAYGGIGGVANALSSGGWTGPYFIGEWGVTGHWEVPRAFGDYAMAIEESGERKRQRFSERSASVYGPARCVGGFAFLWGQKQEMTPTWYGMQAETRSDLGLAGEIGPAADVLRALWQGAWTAPAAPVVDDLTVNALSASANPVFSPGQSMRALCAGGDAVEFVWEILAKPTALGSSGSAEPRPARTGGVVHTTVPEITFAAPAAGDWRLFVHARGGNGRHSTANVPFRCTSGAPVVALPAAQYPSPPALATLRQEPWLDIATAVILTAGSVAVRAPLTISDLQTSAADLTVTANVADATLAAVQIGGSGANRVLILTPGAASGSTTVALNVTDADGHTTTQVLSIQVADGGTTGGSTTSGSTTGGSTATSGMTTGGSTTSAATAGTDPGSSSGGGGCGLGATLAVLAGACVCSWRRRERSGG